MTPRRRVSIVRSERVTTFQLDPPVASTAWGKRCYVFEVIFVSSSGGDARCEFIGGNRRAKTDRWLLPIPAADREALLDLVIDAARGGAA